MSDISPAIPCSSKSSVSSLNPDEAIAIFLARAENILVETDAQLVRLAKYGSKIRVGFIFPIYLLFLRVLSTYSFL